MGIDFYEIKAGVLGRTEGVLNGQYAKVFVFRSYYPDFASPDVLIETECPVYSA